MTSAQLLLLAALEASAQSGPCSAPSSTHLSTTLHLHSQQTPHTRPVQEPPLCLGPSHTGILLPLSQRAFVNIKQENKRCLLKTLYIDLMASCNRGVAVPSHSTREPHRTVHLRLQNGIRTAQAVKDHKDRAGSAGFLGQVSSGEKDLRRAHREVWESVLATQGQLRG